MTGSISKSSLAAILFLFLLPVALSLPLRAQQHHAMETAPQSKVDVKFDFVRPGLPTPKFTLDVNEDGGGTYTAEDASLESTQQIHRDFILTAPTTKKIFALINATHLSPEVCASKAKNVADTGEKTITYTASGELDFCTYNYSENKNVQALTEIFQGIAETMDMGRHLDFLHRFDRLGLNDAMASLEQEISAGQAVEIGTIATSLRSIATDAEVMQRVRTRATALLATIPTELPK